MTANGTAPSPGNVAPLGGSGGTVPAAGAPAPDASSLFARGVPEAGGAVDSGARSVEPSRDQLFSSMRTHTFTSREGPDARAACANSNDAAIGRHERQARSCMRARRAPRVPRQPTALET